MELASSGGKAVNSTRWVYIFLGLAALAVLATGALVVAIVGLDLMGGSASSGSQVSPTPAILPPDQAGGSISGLVWHDLCASGLPGQPTPIGTPDGCVPGGESGFIANGILEPGEPGIGGVFVRLGGGACPASGLAEQTTAGDGRFVFEKLNPGTYCVSIDPGDARNAPLLLPGSWTYPAVGAPAMSTVTILASEQVGDINFGWDYQFLPLPPTPTFTPTASPTVTMTPTPTSTPTPTAPPIPCDWVEFVKDVSIPDETNLSPDEKAIKTWRLKNIGTCTWTTGYDLVFISGDRFYAAKVVPLGKNVKPGATVDVAIEIRAPTLIGKYTDYWGLRNASGLIFGMGPGADEPFWVSIKVVRPKTIAYSFVDHLCDAAWVSTSAELTCPTADYSVDGFVQQQNNPVLEEGRQENEPAIWVIPEGVNGGRISGTYPSFKVKTGDRFRAVVSCNNDSPECDLQFKLEYQIGEGEVKTLGRWDESYDGKFTKIDLDLSPLAGKEVKFILAVRAKDVFDQDSAIWLVPSIYL
jgi:hypothetical protein